MNRSNLHEPDDDPPTLLEPEPDDLDAQIEDLKADAYERDGERWWARDR